MIRLSVTIDDQLVDAVSLGWPAVLERWPAIRERYRLTGVPDTDASVAFAADPGAGPDDVVSYRRTADELGRRLPESVAHIERYLPTAGADLAHSLAVVLVPGGAMSFGPAPGVQLFSLFAAADVDETYLFLIHVYYHELSDLLDGAEARRYSREQRTADEFRRWIRLLVRNEGIGNHAVMPEVRRFAADHPEYGFRYFTYARLMAREGPLEQAVAVLRQVMDQVTDENVSRFRSRAGSILKDRRLPVINLVGTHMAGVIAERLGLTALKEVHQVEATRFFELYGEAGGPYAEALSQRSVAT